MTVRIQTMPDRVWQCVADRTCRSTAFVLNQCIFRLPEELCRVMGAATSRCVPKMAPLTRPTRKRSLVVWDSYALCTSSMQVVSNDAIRRKCQSVKRFQVLDRRISSARSRSSHTHGRTEFSSRTPKLTMTLSGKSRACRHWVDPAPRSIRLQLIPIAIATPSCRPETLTRSHVCRA